MLPRRLSRRYLHAEAVLCASAQQCSACAWTPSVTGGGRRVFSAVTVVMTSATSTQAGASTTLPKAGEHSTVGQHHRCKSSKRRLVPCNPSGVFSFPCARVRQALASAGDIPEDVTTVRRRCPDWSFFGARRLAAGATVRA